MCSNALTQFLSSVVLCHLIACHMAIIPKRFICSNGPSGSFVLLPCLYYLSLCPFVFLFFNFTILLSLLLLSFFLSLSPSLSQHDLISQLPPFCSLMCRIIKIVCSTICHSTNLSRNHYVACQLEFLY